MVEEIMVELQPVIVNTAIAIITAVATFIGNEIHKFLKEKIDTDTKKRVVETTCRYVNQVYKDLNGPVKFEKAKENIVAQLNEKGIKFSELELDVLIESTVNSIKYGTTKVEEPKKIEVINEEKVEE